MTEIIDSSISKSDIAYNYIKKRIINNTYKQGTPLVERNLCKEIDISRTPVREALNRLASEGLVEVIPGIGTLVARLSYTNMVELFDVREMVEINVVKLFIERKSEPSLTALKKTFSKLKKAYDERNISDFMEYDTQFHAILLKGSKHKLYSHIMNMIVDQIEMLGVLAVDDDGVLEKSIKEHEQLLEAIDASEIETAQKIMCEHIRNARDNSLSKFFLLK